MRHRERLTNDTAASSPIVQCLLSHFRPLLIKVVSAHLPHRLRRRVDPEDVVQVALWAFSVRLLEGGYHFASGADVKHLLVVIARDKTREETRRHHAACRDIDHERTVGETPGNPNHQTDPVDRHAGPIEEAVERDTVESVIRTFPPHHQSIIRCWIERHTAKEIAGKLNCCPRQVSLVLAEFSKRLEESCYGNDSWPERKFNGRDSRC